MASLETIKINPVRRSIDTGDLEILEGGGLDVPLIYFEDGIPWVAANEYAIEKLELGKDNKTVNSFMRHLKSYASWLESKDKDWRDFPQKKKDRVLFIFKGYLVGQRENRLLSPSTVSERMRCVIQFYRWAMIYRWIEKRDLWDDTQKIVRFHNAVGLERTMGVQSSELTIPNRARRGATVEGGLLPITTENQNVLLDYLKNHSTTELYLMFKTAFLTGARSETIRTLGIHNLETALSDSGSSGVRYVNVGPGTGVKTKHGVTGAIPFASQLLGELLDYAYSEGRLNRQALAKEPDRTVLFLTSRGNRYSETSFTKLVSDLRRALITAGLSQFAEFHFHQTRATFGTHLMRFALERCSNVVDAIRFVRDTLMHKSEATTWQYVTFVNQEPIKEGLSLEFYSLFCGVIKNEQKDQLINNVVFDND